MKSHRLHASSAARYGQAVLLLGAAGAGKSDLLLRLIDRGFVLVADDQVEVAADGRVSAPAALAGLVEARGQGLFRLPYQDFAQLRLAVNLRRGDRLPQPSLHLALGVPQIDLDPWQASAAIRVDLALACVTGGGVVCAEGALA